MSADDMKKDCETENRKKTRENLIQEILDTEINYVTDLKCYVDMFLKTSDVNQWKLEGVEIGQLFLNLEKIYETSEKLLQFLNKYVKGFDFDQQTVGQCFLEVAADFENVYSYYCVNIHSACDYESTISEHPLMLAKIEQLTDHYQDTNKVVTLNSMLMKPIQRITKYPLLLDSLLEATEVDHIDFKGLDQANSCFKNIINNVNEGKRRNEVVCRYRKHSDASLTDKIANLSSHSFKKKITRLKGTVAVKTGFMPIVRHEEFEFNLKKFYSIQTTVSNLKENLKAYLQEFQKSTTIFYELVSHVVDIYGEEARNLFLLHLQELCKAACSICHSITEQVTTFLLLPLTELIKLYEGPLALIYKRNDKLMEIYGNQSLELVKKEYEALNYQLMKDLPDLCKISEEIVLDIIVNFILLKNNYQKRWFTDLKTFIEFIETKDVKKEEESSNWQMKFYQLQFHQYDVNPVQILTSVLPDVPVLPFQTSEYRFSLNQCPPTNIIDNVKLKQSLMIDEDDGFYFAKMPYNARANQPEVSLYDGQFVTVTAKNDGNGNTEWWEVNTGDKVGYCPASYLEKATNFMETGEIPFSDFTNVDIS